MNIVQPIRDIDTIHAIQSTLKTKNKRDYLLFNIGIYVGIRISDILNIKVRDIKNKDFFYLREIKTNKEKMLPIQNTLKREIAEYIDENNLTNSDYLFKSRKMPHKPITRVQAYNILKRISNEFKLESIGTHTLRKTFGYHFYKKTKDVALLMTIFNHSDPSITLRYIGISQDKINDAMKNFSY